MRRIAQEGQECSYPKTVNASCRSQLHCGELFVISFRGVQGAGNHMVHHDLSHAVIPALSRRLGVDKTIGTQFVRAAHRHNIIFREVPENLDHVTIRHATFDVNPLRHAIADPNHERPLGRCRDCRRRNEQ